ncbi:hypothetical protein EYC84_011930 [Monilinia fructicola]|uniref:Knr4/Smi1-like domain-containing protein n=1 Tax=Monilinia fructicola TaxID=38448 RepID=A0A5M9J6S1_MONFR|nr:hypothetical protein EYC84_011930 [Monilinia fructicola]
MRIPVSPFAPPASPGPQSPYSPGMRSSTLQRQSTQENFENVTPGEIQLQAFQEGLPPPPPVGHSWRRIDKWAEENYEELWDQLCEGCTNNDLNELEHQLDCSLPMEVRESMQLHDGQERGGLPTGIIFGSMLLDCEEIVQEWENWKKVNQEYLTESSGYKPSMPPKALGGSSSSSSKQPANAQNPYWRQDLLSRQDSQPPNAIQKVYAHPAWIPLDPLANGDKSFLFGRDYDCKYVVARSWSAFLATVADDLSSGKWFVDEETNELKLKEFKSGKVEPGYFDILRWRMDQKYGRKNVRRRSLLHLPAAEVGEPRGRSMQRFSGASPIPSPNRPGYGKSSPLAKVTEESSGSGIKVNTIDIPATKLVDVQTPRPSEENKPSDRPLMESESPSENKENEKTGEKAVGLGLVTETSEKETPADDESAMKTIEI